MDVKWGNVEGNVGEARCIRAPLAPPPDSLRRGAPRVSHQVRMNSWPYCRPVSTVLIGEREKRERERERKERERKDRERERNGTRRDETTRTRSSDAVFHRMNRLRSTWLLSYSLWAFAFYWPQKKKNTPDFFSSALFYHFTLKRLTNCTLTLIAPSLRNNIVDARTLHIMAYMKQIH